MSDAKSRRVSQAKRFLYDRLMGPEAIRLSADDKGAVDVYERRAMLSAAERGLGMMPEEPVVLSLGERKDWRPFLSEREGGTVDQRMEELKKRTTRSGVSEQAWDAAVKDLDPEALLQTAVANSVVTEPGIQLARKSGQRGAQAAAQAFSGIGELPTEALQELAGNVELGKIATHLADKVGIKYGEAAKAEFAAQAAEFVRKGDAKGLASYLQMAENEVAQVLKPEASSAIDAAQQEKTNVPLWQTIGQYGLAAGGGAAAVGLANYLMSQGLQQSSAADYNAAMQERQLASIYA